MCIGWPYIDRPFIPHTYKKFTNSHFHQFKFYIYICVITKLDVKYKVEI